MNDAIGLELSNILRNFHRNSPHPEADAGDVDAAVDAILRVVGEEMNSEPVDGFSSGGYVGGIGGFVPAILDNHYPFSKEIPKDIIERLRAIKRSDRSMIIGVDMAPREDFSVEWVSMSKEEYDALKRREQDLLEANNRYLDRARVAEGEERKVRDGRQAAQLQWAHETFGGIEGFDPCSIQERTRRFIEEAIELAQSLGVSAEESSHILKYVYSREAGDAFQEFGGTALTLGCLAQAAGISVCEAEVAEFDRVQMKSKAHFEARHRAKMESGL